MSLKYQSILGVFIAITLLLALILWALISLPDRRRPELVPGWQTTSAEGYTFQYPGSFNTQYLHALGWPPKLQVLDKKFSCFEVGSSEFVAGKTESRRISGQEYCVTEIVGAAAGSTYTEYAYAFEEDDKTFVLSFTVQAPQCGNYEEPEMQLCQDEQNSFELDTLVNKIVQTIYKN